MHHALQDGHPPLRIKIRGQKYFQKNFPYLFHADPKMEKYYYPALWIQKRNHKNFTDKARGSFSNAARKKGWKIKMKIKNLNIRSGISVAEKQHVLASFPCNSESMFTVTVPENMAGSSSAYPLKKYNLFDCSCLHTEPSETAFQKTIAFSFLYKSSLPNNEACEDNTTVSILCKKNPAGFFRYLTESGFQIEKCSSGIYHVDIKMPVQIFIAIQSELDSKVCCLVDSLLKKAARECSENLNFPECIFHTAESWNILKTA